MVNILIKPDNYGYITCDNEALFELIKKSFTRHVLKYDNYFRTYRNHKTKFYTLRDKGVTMRVKAGLIKPLCNSFDVQGVEYNLVDKRDKADFSDVERIIKLSDKVTLFDYQQTALSRILDNPYCTVQLPTGAGKTEVSAAIIKNYFQKYSHRVLLYVVPTTKLQNEAMERFEEYGIETNKNIPFLAGKANVTTYATLMRTKKLTKSDYNEVGCIIFDECHHLKADKSSRIVNDFGKLQMCVGLSATLTEDIEINKVLLKRFNDTDLKIFGSTGLPVYYKPIEETIEEEVVTPVRIHIIDNPENVKVDSSDWHDIRRKLLQSNNRNQIIADLVYSIMFDKGDLNTVCVLIPEVEWSRNCMALVYEKLRNKLDDVRIFLMSGGDTISEIVAGGDVINLLTKEEKKEAEEAIKNPNVKTVFSATSFFYEGINISNIQGLINAYGGKSHVRVKQQLGRAMRLFDGKNIAHLFELYDRNIVLNTQLNIRLNIYKKDYNAKVVKYII